MMVQIAVFGASNPSKDEIGLAEEVGYLLGKAGCVVICGGLGGVMEAVCRGVKRGGGLTVGVLPGRFRYDANRYVDVAVVTGMGEARNVVVAFSGEAAIAIGGGLGTLTEIGHALRNGIPVVGLRTWELEERRLKGVKIHRADSADEAVRKALLLAERGEEAQV